MCCCRNCGWRSSGAADGAGGSCGGEVWRWEAEEELGVDCCGGRDSWTKQMPHSESGAVEEGEVGQEVREEEQVEEVQQVADPNAGPCFPG